MAVTLLFVFLTVSGWAAGCNFYIKNNSPDTIHVGIQGDGTFGQPFNGGFLLPPGASQTVPVAAGWSGKVWGRKGCNFDANGFGPCDTGDCGGVMECNGGGPVLPVTHAVISVGPPGVMDSYFVSVMYGFNVAMQMKPTGGSGVGFNCGTAGCDVDFNPECPSFLKYFGCNNVSACRSSCLAFQTDQYCCTGPYTNNMCAPSPSAVYFKSYCPFVCSYPNDQTCTFNCQNTDYDITFG